MSTLPKELLFMIIREIVNTRALFIFDVDIEQSRYPRILPNNPRMRFHYVVDPPTTQPDHASWPGTYESEISKTIRNLILTSDFIKYELCKSKTKLGLTGVIKVPTTSGHDEIRFNPEKHIICVRNVNYYTNIQDDSWTDLDFKIEHLAFMGGNHDDFRILRCAFPGIRHIYGVYVNNVRIRPDKPIDVVWPARERHSLSPEFLCLANRAFLVIKRKLYCERHDSEIAHIPNLEVLPFHRLVLV